MRIGLSSWFRLSLFSQISISLLYVANMIKCVDFVVLAFFSYGHFLASITSRPRLNPDFSYSLLKNQLIYEMQITKEKGLGCS